jgi:two-component system NtrC family sensor kinase
MQFSPGMSLRRKQTLIIMLTSSIVLLLACAAFVTYDTVTFRRKLVENISVLADAVGTNSAAAIDFTDPVAATETLGALRANHNVVSACVYSRDGSVLAVYRRDRDDGFVPPPMEASAQVFSGDQLHLFRPITQRNELTGTIFVASDLKELSARLWRYLGIVGVVLLASLLAGLALSNRLQRVISDPILELADVARSVALDKNYSVRARKQTNDELGQLVEGFNEMLAQIQARDTALEIARVDRERRAEERTRELEIIHQQLVEASRRAGMAEIASNVLHNVGNVLNSVNISTGLIVDSVKNFHAGDLARAVALMQEHGHDLGEYLTNDSRGRHLPVYLGQLSEQFLADQKGMVGELDSLRRNVDHIKEIVAMQQNYAAFGGVKEMIDVVNLVEDSLRMTEESLNRHQVEIVRQFDPVPPANVEKHKILQILVNLLRNAKDACNESNRTDKRLTVRVSVGDERIKITVMDNGIGIPIENLARIFNHGFTTRADGHGFGLHSGALAAKDLGGSLTVHSGGAGQGAAFTLELPSPKMEVVS